MVRWNQRKRIQLEGIWERISLLIKIRKNMIESADQKPVRALAMRAAGVTLALVVMLEALTAAPAYASSVEFSRTAEQWASLQDHVLEYGELADLIHEYNVTVQNNQYEYNKFIKDYGRTKTDVADSYRDMADDLEDQMTGDDGMSMVSDFQLQQQAKSLREQADDNVEDSHIYYLNYSLAEDSLVLSAQSKMISYYSDQLSLENAKLQKQSLENALALAQTQRAAGAATDTTVLDAQAAIQTQEKNIASLEQTIESDRQALIVMCGWKSSDQPEIQAVPEVDLEAVNAIDLTADKQTALEKNYTLLVNQRKLENAQNADNQANLKKTIAGNERQIGVSVTSAYQSLQTAKSTYEQALADQETTERSLSQAAVKLAAGMSTNYEYQTQVIAANQQELTVQTAKLNLLKAYETYQWNVNGLASAS